MIKGLFRTHRGQQITVAIAFALVYTAIDQASIWNWTLTVGLQMAVLLLTQQRYWAALLVGFFVPNAIDAWSCVEQWGWQWAAMRAFPDMLITAAVVWYGLQHLKMFPTKDRFNITTMLTCSVLVALLIGTYSAVLLSLVKDIEPQYRPDAVAWATYVNANISGLLTMVPLALMARSDIRRFQLSEIPARLFKSQIFVDGLCVSVPMIIALALATAHESGAAEGVLIELAMIFPAAWMTYKHGWRAVVISGTLIVMCNAILRPNSHDLVSLSISAALNLGVMALYAFGARVSVQKATMDDEASSLRLKDQVMRQNLLITERKLKIAAQQMEHAAGHLSVVNGRMLEQLRRTVPNVESQAFYKQGAKVHERLYQLAESLHPTAWRERGLPAALTETLGRALDEAGMSYRCEISGRGFMALQNVVLSAVYRMACEAVCHVASDLTCSGIRLAVRGGQSGGRSWVVLRIEGILDENEVAKAVFFTEARRDLGLKLGASFLDLDDMRAHVSAFEGQLHVRSKVSRYVVTCLLHDQKKEAKDYAPAPLWVT